MHEKVEMSYEIKGDFMGEAVRKFHVAFMHLRSVIVSSWANKFVAALSFAFLMVLSSKIRIFIEPISPVPITLHGASKLNSVQPQRSTANITFPDDTWPVGARISLDTCDQILL